MTYTPDSLIEMVGRKAAEKALSPEALKGATVTFADGVIRITSAVDGVAVQAKTEIGTDVNDVLAAVAAALNDGSPAPAAAPAKASAKKTTTKAADPEPEPTPAPEPEPVKEEKKAEEPIVPPTVDDYGSDDDLEEGDEDF